MKILFVGDASNMHNCLARELREMGHEAIVASNGSRWMNTGRDINLLRGSGKLGAVRYVFDILKALPKMRGYDIVEIAGHIFLTLRPKKIRRVFDYLKKHNGKIVLSALNTDYFYYRACHDGHTFRYSDYMLGNEPSPYVNSAEYKAQRQENWAKDFMPGFADLLSRDRDYAESIFAIGRGGKKPRKDLTVWGDVPAYAGFFYDELFKIEDEYPESFAKADVAAALADADGAVVRNLVSLQGEERQQL